MTTEAPADSNSTDVDVDDLDLDLPSQLGFRVDGVPLFDGIIDAANTVCAGDGRALCACLHGGTGLGDRRACGGGGVR